NSQSGKGGVAYVMESDFGLKLPRALQVEFSKVVQRITDATEKELSPQNIWDAFEREYLSPGDSPKLADKRIELSSRGEDRQLSASLNVQGSVRRITGQGNGPIDAFMNALQRECGIDA